MFELRDSLGRQLFETIAITLVCDECMKTDHPEKCQHKLAEMPRWLSSQKMEVVKSLLADDPAMLLRESMGICADASSRAFPSADVEAFLKRIYNDIPQDLYGAPSNEANHVIIAVDPAGGGSSQFAIFSMCQMHNGTVMCLGADALRTKDVRETHKAIIKHIESTRRIPGLQDSTAVLVLESNLAFESQHILHLLQRNQVRRWVALSEGAGGGIGWLTTNERKETMCLQVRDALRVGCIGLHRNFFCNTMDVKEMLKTIDGELRNFCVLVEAAKTPFGKSKKTYSGKVGGRNDDVCIVLQLALTGCRVFYQSDKYNSFRGDAY